MCKRSSPERFVTGETGSSLYVTSLASSKCRQKNYLPVTPKYKVTLERSLLLSWVIGPMILEQTEPFAARCQQTLHWNKLVNVVHLSWTTGEAPERNISDISDITFAICW